MNRKNLLVTLSVALNVGLVVYLVFGGPDTVINLPAAYGQNRAVAGGGIVATTAEVSSTRQAIYIVDNREKRMNVYAFPSGRGGLQAIGAVDLRSEKAFGAGLAGDVIMVPGRISSTNEVVYVIDPVGRKLIVYGSKGKGIEVLDARDLGKDFTAP